MLRLRGRAWWAAGLGLLLLLALLWSLLLPRLVLGRLESKLAPRGLMAEVEDVHVALNGARLDGVKIQSVEPGLLLRAQTIAVEVLPWRFLFGSASVSQVEVRGAVLQVDLASAGLKKLFGASKSPSGASGGGSRALPPVRWLNGKVQVRDAVGSLIECDKLEAVLSAQEWSARAGSLRVGSEPGEVISLEHVEAAGKLEGRRPVLRTASVENARLQWAPEGASAKADDGLPSATGRTKARLRAAVSLLRGSSAAQAKPGSDPAERKHYWSEDATVMLKQARFTQGPASAAKTILSGLSVSLSAQGTDSVRVQVDGKNADAGGIKLDLRVLPHALRAEGNVLLKDVSLALFAPALPPLPFYDLERTRVNAELSLKAEGLSQMAASGQLEITDLTFASEGLARLPVGPINMLARGDATWNPARRELVVAPTDLDIGAVRGLAAGVLAWPSDGYRVDATFQLHKSPCQEVLKAVPVGLLDELSTLEMGGSFGAKLVAHVDSTQLDLTKLDFDVDDGCKFKALPPILDLLRFQQPFMHRVLEPDGTIFEFETGPGTPAWTPIELISPFMVQAVVAHEDGRFFTHHGFAEPEIAVALSRNLKAKAFRFGASTITMQLVKNVFLHRDKLLSRKVQEALITWWLEGQWDKRHILELYLNVIEYGPAIYGLRNAAWHYFGAIPMNLTPAQSAFLATILPSPKTMHSQYDEGKLSASMKSRLSAFLRHMRARERIDEEALAFGLEELEHFTFYRPEQPPPPPPLIRGTAAAPPFDVPAAEGLDAWDTFEVPAGPVEDGSFGSAN